jgi:nucleotide-binding universal stress UspA family protein
METVFVQANAAASGRGRGVLRETTDPASVRLPMPEAWRKTTISLSKERTETMFETIVWATDGSDLADGALEHVRRLAEVHGSRIVAVHANELLQGRFGGASLLADEPDIREKLESQLGELRSDGFDASLEIRTGSQDAATLVEGAAQDYEAELIVVGTHGRGGVAAALMGSVARSLCHTAQRPVLVVPPASRVEQPAKLTTA